MYRRWCYLFSDFPDILNVIELCELLNIGRNTCLFLLQSGRIEAVKIGRQWRVSKAAVMRYMRCYWPHFWPLRHNYRITLKNTGQRKNGLKPMFFKLKSTTQHLSKRFFSVWHSRGKGFDPPHLHHKPA